MFTIGGTSNRGFYPYEITNSLRMPNTSNDHYLNIGSSIGAGNMRTWTLSYWVKRSELGVQRLISPADTAGDEGYFGFVTDEFYAVDYDGSSHWNIITNATYRDMSAWYHFVFSFDTTQSTASDRITLWVNGEEQTSLSTANYPSQNYESHYNGGDGWYIGRRGQESGSSYDGYLAEFAFVDGTALDATDFGEYKNGIWIPKNLDGITWGSKGWYLDFSDSSNIGKDFSGNGHDFTATNLSSHDVVPDSPTNNFCTMNILDDNFSTPKFTYSEGNLKYTYSYTGAGFDRVFGTIAILPGDTNKYYMEFTGNVTNEQMQWGIVATDSSTYSPSDRTQGVTAASDINTLRWAPYRPAPYLRRIDGDGDNALTTTNGNAANGDIFSIVYDAGAGKFFAWFNGVEFSGQDYSAGTSLWTTLDTTKTYAVMMYQGDGGVTTKGGNCTANFGQDSSFAGAKTAQGNTDSNGIGDFYYTVPSGAVALCTANLPEPDISPANGQEPADYFDIQLWTGTGSGQSFSNWSFQPDWLWFKQRNGSSGHALFDSIRGVNAGLSSDSTSAENNNANSTQDLVSFDSDGFTTGTPSQYGSLGGSGNTIVTWGWAGGGTAVSNTDGSTTTSVSANTKAGFSILTYEGTSSSATLGHGLDIAPEMIITKNIDRAINWVVWHKGLNSSTGNGNDYILLNTTDAELTDGGGNVVNNVGASTYTVGNFNAYNANAETHVAYCFHSVEGYSKVGSYTGNGSSDGPFVHCGFKPAWVMIKRTDSTTSWYIHDSKRDDYNEVDLRLVSDGAYSEASEQPRDFLSNGFKLRTSNGGTNASGGTYIFLAFSEQPFKYSTGR